MATPTGAPGYPPGAAGLAGPLSAPPVLPPSPAAPPPPKRSGFSDALRRWPVVVVLLLSPGIVEYLSGSSPLNAIVLNPAGFLLQVGLNAGLYGPGVLLVREAVLRWRKGWVSLLVLGAAYGIVEEGIALSTMFNPTSPVVHSLGIYGHWMGVNTVWIPGVLIVHMLYSIALPIYLLGLLLPELRGRPLLGGRRLSLAVAFLLADVVALIALVRFGQGYFMGWPLLVGSVVVVALLVVVAYRLPGNLLEGPTARARAPSAWLSGLAGLAFFPVTIFVEGICASNHAAPAVAIAAIVGVGLLEGLFAVRYLRGPAAYRARLGFLLGALLPILTLGAISQLPLDFVLGGDAVLVLVFARLARRSAQPALPRLDGPGAAPTGP